MYILWRDQQKECNERIHCRWIWYHNNQYRNVPPQGSQKDDLWASYYIWLFYVGTMFFMKEKLGWQTSSRVSQFLRDLNPK
jgi:hypothetical protein